MACIWHPQKLIELVQYMYLAPIEWAQRRAERVDKEIKERESEL
jgi:hypothetical protein